jgi:hypothetical protein
MDSDPFRVKPDPVTMMTIDVPRLITESGLTLIAPLLVAGYVGCVASGYGRYGSEPERIPGGVADGASPLGAELAAALGLT